MNNAGTVLLTVADMSVIEAEVEVDETDIPLVQIGQKAKVTIDAIAGKTFPGRVTEIGNSPIQPAAGQAAATAPRTATNFKVVVTLDAGAPRCAPASPAPPTSPPPPRPASWRCRSSRSPCASSITTRRAPSCRSCVRRRRRGGASDAPGPGRPGGPTELPLGHTRKEIEGVFLVKDGKATFMPVEVGIAGERYFEVVKGLAAGDRVITGPFDSVRNLYDGDDVREAPAPAAASALTDRADQALMSQTLGGGEAGAGLDLVQQAALAADPARQHRRGVVDHRGGRRSSRA